MDDLDFSSSKRTKRAPGSCDTCKRKKIRCDSGMMPGRRCTACIQTGQQCTRMELSKNLGSAKIYVESLEAQLDKMEKLLHSLLPGVDIRDRLQNGSPISSSSPSDIGSIPRNDDDEETRLVPPGLEELAIEANLRFLGKSSGLHLFHTALHAKQNYDGKSCLIRSATAQRLEYWGPQFWQLGYAENARNLTPYTFPESSLMLGLVDLYFANVNLFAPLLHRPTFEGAIADGRHLVDRAFGATVLLVCALGSRHTDDERVLLDPSLPQSGGWQWFSQVTLHRPVLVEHTSLYDLQAYVLSAIYRPSVSVFASVWVDIGFALRMGQDIGIHRRKHATRYSAETELWKRVFWMLMILDRDCGALLGRPVSLQEEDYDVDLPLPCDDEYWDTTPSGFQQPQDRPCLMTGFVLWLQLSNLEARTMRQIYSVKRDPLQKSDPDIIAELDSALNNWLDSVPDYLRWDPDRKDSPFMRQSVHLYVRYHHLLIFIHRPFIPTPSVASSLSFSSLVICTNAARACVRVAQTMLKQPRWTALHNVYISTTIAALVLLLNSWTRSRSERSEVIDRDMECVRICMEVLQHEEIKTGAGRYWDILHELFSATHSDGSFLPRNLKRQRETTQEPGPTAANRVPVVPRTDPPIFNPSLDLPNDTFDFTDAYLTGPPLAQGSQNFAPSEFGLCQPSHPAEPIYDEMSSWAEPQSQNMTSYDVPSATALWSSLPTSFNPDDWGAFLESLSAQPQWNLAST